MRPPQAKPHTSSRTQLTCRVSGHRHHPDSHPFPSMTTISLTRPDTGTWDCPRPSAQPPTGQPVSKARGCGSLTSANGPRRVSTARRGRRPRCFPGTRGHWSMALPVSSRPSPRTAREPRHSSRGRAGSLRAASHGAMRTLTPPLGVGRENTLQHAQRRAPDVAVFRVSRRADPRRAGTFRSGL